MAAEAPREGLIGSLKKSWILDEVPPLLWICVEVIGLFSATVEVADQLPLSPTEPDLMTRVVAIGEELKEDRVSRYR